MNNPVRRTLGAAALIAGGIAFLGETLFVANSPHSTPYPASDLLNFLLLLTLAWIILSAANKFMMITNRKFPVNIITTIVLVIIFILASKLPPSHAELTTMQNIYGFVIALVWPLVDLLDAGLQFNGAYDTSWK